MPIRSLLFASEAFTAKEIAAVTCAFEDALYTLGLVDREAPAVTMVAERMFELARGGETDPILLRYAVLKSLRGDPGTSGC